MKKCLVFSLLAALAFGAQAGDSVSYWVRITQIQAEELLNAGTLPGTVQMSLIDTGYNNKIVYTTTFNFDKLYVKSAEGNITLGEGAGTAYIRPDGRFDIAQYVEEYERGSAPLPNDKLATDRSFVFADKMAYGTHIEYQSTLDYDNVYEGFLKSGGSGEAEAMAYAKKYLVTMFEVDGQYYQLQIDAPDDDNVLNSSADKMSLTPVPVVPEPTSGLLLLMGLAGLALKRKRAK